MISAPHRTGGNKIPTAYSALKHAGSAKRTTNSASVDPLNMRHLVLKTRQPEELNAPQTTKWPILIPSPDRMSVDTLGKMRMALRRAAYLL